MPVKGKVLIMLAIILAVADVAFLVYFFNVPGYKGNEQQKIKVEMANLILEKDDVGVTEFLNNHSTFDVNEEVRPEYSSVQLAAQWSSKDVLTLLIEHGGDLTSITTTQNMTLLHLSVINGNFEMTKYLLGKGLDINDIDINEYTPLLYAITYGHNEIVDLLIDRGADINISDSYGVTPLLMAVQMNDIRSTERLVAEGADINSTDQSGNTPLHFAVMRGVSEDFITFLLESGANDTNKNDKGETPYEISEENHE
jgi:ankyrin repeat protein